MQQLLGNQPGVTDDDGAFLRELFLQRLPSNVRMVLASTDETLTTDKLADLADRVMEVAATPSMSTAAMPHLTKEVDQLRTEVTRLQGLVKSLTTQSRSRRSSRSQRSTSPTLQQPPTDAYPEI